MGEETPRIHINPRCPNCGGRIELDADQATCPYCGAEFDTIEPSVPAPPTAPPTPGPTDTPSRHWGIRAFLLLPVALIAVFLETALGWAVIGPNHDGTPAFLLWCGVGPLVLLFTAVIWDSYARKLLSLLGIFFSVTLGYIAGLAISDFEFFLRVCNGSYLDDMAAFWAIVFGAHLTGFLLGLVIHALVGSARAQRGR